MVVYWVKSQTPYSFDLLYMNAVVIGLKTQLRMFCCLKKPVGFSVSDINVAA